ncbi:hypothetical protein [Hoylesella saccharolytica]|uniref:hypothetical protein n=1 Tax=Hoylesella saccharolytica TaxID=633701 RepID=UPI0028E19A63|nr:hypothetical protein [Hoylesella saccharolytica]
MRFKHKFKKRLTPLHQDFVNKYVCTRYDPRGIYYLVFFCEDNDIAFVKRKEDYDDFEAWGCVNMSNELLVPFEYRRIWDYGRFLIAKNSVEIHVYNKKGKMLYNITSVKKTTHKAYSKLLDSDSCGFRLAIRKMAISKSLYYNFHVLENGLAFLLNREKKVGLVLFSKLKLPFEYEAVAIPQNGYTLAIKKTHEISKLGVPLYDCLLIKVKNQIKKENSIHHTGIMLFEKKTWNEIQENFGNTELIEKKCNSIICYNEKVNINPYSLEFFPFDLGLTNQIDNEEINYNQSSDMDYQWTDEDTWDAMTDGQYGDYPGSNWDSEIFGY